MKEKFKQTHIFTNNYTYLFILYMNTIKVEFNTVHTVNKYNFHNMYLVMEVSRL